MSRVTSRAEKALRKAIDEETAELVEQLNGFKQRCERAEGLLKSILEQIQVARLNGAPVQPVLAPILTHKAPVQEEIPSEPASDLAEQDNLGEGRWV